MGKKPVLGLIGLAWLGLAVGGCKHCDCDKTAQAPRKKYADNYTKSHRQAQPQDGVDQQQLAPEEGAIAAKGAVDPRAQPGYDCDPGKYAPNAREPREQENVAEQIQRQPDALPTNLTPENTSALKRSAGAPEIVQTGRTTDMPATASSVDAQMQPMTRSQGTVPTTTVGTGGEDVVPHTTRTSLPAGDPMGRPVPPAPPFVEKAGTLPPPPPAMGMNAGTPTGAIPVLEPASLPSTSQPLPTAPPAPSAGMGAGVAPAGAVIPPAGVVAPPAGGVAPPPGAVLPPAGAVIPPAPTNPLSGVPAPANALSGGVKDVMPPMPVPPQAPAPLPSVPAPTPGDPLK